VPGLVNYKKGCTRLAATSDNFYQLLAHGLWFSPGTPASSTTKTGRLDITEILLKVVLSTINQSINFSIPIKMEIQILKYIATEYDYLGCFKSFSSSILIIWPSEKTVYVHVSCNQVLPVSLMN
jgi:hypothetical protein